MIEKGKIGAPQMALILYATILSTAMLIVPSVTAEHAGRDLWIAVLLAGPTGAASILIAYQLSKMYPGKTLVEYNEIILGRMLGKAVNALFLLFIVIQTSTILKEYALFIFDNFYARTPIIVIIATLCLVCAMNVRGGIEVIARSSQIFVPLLIVLYFAIILLIIPSLKPKLLLPVLEFGWKPPLMGSIIPHGWFSQFFIVSFLFPYLTDQQKRLKWSILSLLLVIITMVVTVVAIMSLFGELTGHLAYPVMIASRYISIAGFFEHLESIAMMVWVTGTFVKVSIFYYISVLGAAQWAKLSDYRPLVLPIGILITYMTLWIAPADYKLLHFISTSLPFLFLTMLIVLPFTILIIAVTSNRLRGKAR